MEQGGLRDAASLGEITPQVLRATFPDWRIFLSSTTWWAVRGGFQEFDGPRSLLHCTLTSADLTVLADKLCAQDYLGKLSDAELEQAWRDMLAAGLR